MEKVGVPWHHLFDAMGALFHGKQVRPEVELLIQA
jgi:hypothetical protein